jgi:hypothetical protein
MSSLNLPKKTYDLASKLIKIERELLELLEACNYDPNRLEGDSLRKYNSLTIDKEKVKEKIENFLFLAIPNAKVVMKRSQGRLKGLVRVYVSCNSTISEFLFHDKKLRTIALVRVRNDPDFKPEKLGAKESPEKSEETGETRPIVAPIDERVVEEEVKKLGFQHLPSSKYFFYILAQEQ